MDRRHVLAGLATGLTTGLAGCLRDLPTEAPTKPTTTTTSHTTSDTTSDTTGNSAEVRGEHGFPPTICDQDVVEDFGIRAIVDPAFDDSWAGYDISQTYRVVGAASDDPLDDDAAIIGLEHDGRFRAYPITVLWSHEIVNDDFGGPVMATYCSLCATGMVAERRVDGEPTIFGVSGQLWRPPDVYAHAAVESNRTFGAWSWKFDGSVETNVRVAGNLVMYDEATRSFWSQFLARAICGPQAGTVLDMVPSTLTTWGEWRADHPDGDVLLPPPYSTLM